MYDFRHFICWFGHGARDNDYKALRLATLARHRARYTSLGTLLAHLRHANEEIMPVTLE